MNQEFSYTLTRRSFGYMIVPCLPMRIRKYNKEGGGGGANIEVLLNSFYLNGGILRFHVQHSKENHMELLFEWGFIVRFKTILGSITISITT